MLTGNPRKIPMNQMLRERLDNFYQLAEDALCRTCCQEGFVSMNVVLCTELEELCKSLYALESKYKGELPLMDEEPREIRWADERKTMDAMANQIVLRGEEQRCFSASVKSRMEEACKIMESIERELDTEYDPRQFASYGRRSLAEYNKLKWNPKRKDVQVKITLMSEARQKKRCEDLLEGYIGQLNGMADSILAENGEEIYYEALGRFIWHSVHDEVAGEAAVDELLCLVKTVEYLCGRLDKQLTFLDQELPADMKNNEETEQDNLRQKTLQNQCPIVTFRLKLLRKYLKDGFTEEWIEKMILDMIHSEHSVSVCHKMKGGKLVKFVHQIAGVLKYNKVLDGCNYDDIVNDLNYSKPKKQSRKDYVRHMMDDEKELQKWLESYIAEWRKRP